VENFTPIPAFTGGLLIGLSAVVMLLFNGRITGISGIMDGIVVLYAKPFKTTISNIQDTTFCSLSPVAD